jgi:uncharacterized membrane protein YfcA
VTGWEILAVFAAGVAAGTINAVVGSGTLITFPTLVAFGLPPVTATVSNAVGLSPGAISGAWGYRRELAGQRARLVRLGSASLVGALAGVALLLGLPEGAFETIVPVLVSLGCVLVLIQPWLSQKVAHRRSADGRGGPAIWALVALAGVYGGYFAAAQGVILTGILGIGLNETLQRVNAAKNVLTSLVNTVAALCFIVIAPVSWPHAGLIAAGSVVGGQIGAHVGRRLPSVLLRTVIVAAGVVAVVMLLSE